MEIRIKEKVLVTDDAQLVLFPEFTGKFQAEATIDKVGIIASGKASEMNVAIILNITATSKPALVKIPFQDLQALVMAVQASQLQMP